MSKADRILGMYKARQHGLTYVAIGRHFHLSPPTVRRTVARELRRRRHLPEPSTRQVAPPEYISIADIARERGVTYRAAYHRIRRLSGVECFSDDNHWYTSNLDSPLLYRGRTYALRAWVAEMWPISLAE